MRTLLGLLGVYRAHLRASLAEQFHYRVAAGLYLIGAILPPVVSISTWSAVAGAQGGRVGDFSGADLAAYFLVQLWVSHATFTYVMLDFERRIRQGELSPRLLKPVHPIHADIAENVAHKLVQLIVLIPVTVALVVAFRPALHPHPWALVAAVPALLLAFLLRFCAEWTLALAAFWTTRVEAVNELYFGTFLFLSGLLAPLTLLPEALQWASLVLPFRWMLAFPVELLLGRLTPEETLRGLAVQGAWLALAAALLMATWRAGLKRYAAVGA
ncbi:MAG TPA: ABC-2 family transporter protein [Chloroflexota bacterium]|nr:ABC-2 family transporter protein [Chloroflexota bacterium]